ncbi:hypothetical protein HPP92_001821 [Vanilla planifolia]|uniref:Cell wall protein n=1 Tax=Vanilla planifolia TaxID=51239 RepID=A0A835RYQ4_VANPL|nr:hypothetical protein HPP92_001821 [Vanilla planifolia]
MARGGYLCFLLLLNTLLPLNFVGTLAGRPPPTDKKDTECIGKQEGSVLIPGVGRYMAGSHELPGFTGLDNSIPAATHPRYLPGNDDTFVPNPGYEVPNPANGGSYRQP